MLQSKSLLWRLAIVLLLLLCALPCVESGAQKTDKGCNKCEKNKTPPEKKQPQGFQSCEVWQQQGLPDNSCPAVDPTPPPSPPGVPAPDCHVDNNLQCSKKERKKGREKSDKHNTQDAAPEEFLLITIGVLVALILIIILASYAIYQTNVRRNSTVAVTLMKNA